MNEDSSKSLLTLLESLPPTPSVTFRGYVDTSITEPRAIASPVLTATSHNISIATNNLAVPQVAIFIGKNGRDLSTRRCQWVVAMSSLNASVGVR